MNPIEVYPCGAEVSLIRSTYVGVIIGISIRDSRVIYEVAYFESGTYKNTWVCPYEFTVGEPCTKQTIGFKAV